MKQLLVAIAVLSQVSCSTQEQKLSGNHLESPADQIDSAKYLMDKGPLTGQSKTIDVSYAGISCTCAQWCETRFTGDTASEKEYFYLEPASSTIVQADTVFDGESLPVRLSLTGRFYSKKGFPKHYFPTKGDPDAARVFRYDKISVVQRGK